VVQGTQWYGYCRVNATCSHWVTQTVPGYDVIRRRDLPGRHWFFSVHLFDPVHVATQLPVKPAAHGAPQVSCRVGMAQVKEMPGGPWGELVQPACSTGIGVVAPG